MAAAAVLLLCVLAGFAWRAQHGLWFTTFSDETGHLVGAKAISAGYTLYRDFVDYHGPLIYALPQLYGALFGWNDLNDARLVPVLFMGLTTLSLILSPVFSDTWQRLMAAALFVGLTGTAWLVQALFMLDYQPIAGMLLMIGLAQFTVPAWAGARVGSAGLLVGGLVFALTPFVAFTYGPAAVLFLLAGVWVWLRERTWRTLIFLAFGAAAGLAATIAWMVAFADFRGYVAYHFIAALRYHAPYSSPAGFLPVVTVLRPGFAPGNVIQTLGVVAAAVAGAGLIIVRRRRMSSRLPLVPFCISALGVILTNPRASPGFQNGAFIIVSFGLAATVLTMLPRIVLPDMTSAWRTALVAAALMVIAAAEQAARSAVSTPHGYTRAALADAENGSLRQSDASWAQKLRRLTRPDEQTLALPFYPDFYIQAGRLPMRGYFVYLPWDADFGRHTVLGLKHELCDSLAANPPPVLYYNGWVVWDKYDPRDYMPCVLGVIARNYQKMPGEPDIYVRNDQASRLANP